MIPGILAQRRRAGGIVIGDPYWDSVVLLARMNGSPANLKTMQFSNAGTVAWAAGKFGQAMSLSTGDSGAVANASTLDFALPGDFTIELFVKPTSRVDGALISHFDLGGASPGWQVYYTTSGKIEFYRYAGSGSYPARGNVVLALGVFSHIAVVRSAGVVSIYVNGVLDATGTDAAAYGNNLLTMSIGYQLQGGARYPFRGEIDEVRITKNVARYTGAFAPPSAEFPAVSGGINPDVGVVWTARTAPLRLWGGVAWSPERSVYAAVAYSGTATSRAMSSADGVTWASRTTPGDAGWISVCWAPALNLFVAVAFSGTASARAMTSPDGVNWTARTTPLDRYWYSVCWSPELSLLVAVAYGGTTAGSRVMTSPNGVTWTARTTPADILWSGVCWAAGLGLFVAVAGTGTGSRVMTSPDGINWKLRRSPEQSWTRVAWSQDRGRLVAVGSDGSVMSSPDGINWTGRAVPDSSWRDVTWSPAQLKFVAISASGTGEVVLTSL